MPHCWARVRARTNAPLRRGAWYRVVRLNADRAVLEVNRQHIPFARGMLQVLPIRPPTWSVVPKPPNSTYVSGTRYGVCPSCSDRQRLDEGAVVMRCRRCRGTFAIGWSDAMWRPFEVRAGSPAERALAKARAAALEALKSALRLPKGAR
jgi:hypothetical protein